MIRETTIENFGVLAEQRMIDELKLAPSPGFDELLDIRNLAGESTGYIKVFGGDRIEKASSLSIVMAPGMRYFNIHIIPDANYDVPRYLFEGMLRTGGSQVSMDLFPDLDAAMHIDHLKQFFAPVTDIYNEARKDEDIPFVQSRQMHMRAFSSPFFLCTFGADERLLGKLESYADRYFDTWLVMHRAARQQTPAQAEMKKNRRSHVARTLIAEDPDRHLVVQVYGEETTQAIETANML